MSWQQEYLARYEQRLKEEFTVNGDYIEAKTESYNAVPLGAPVIYGHTIHGITLDDAPDKLSWGPMVVGMTSKENLYDKYPERAENTREICGND